ncbi:MFS transporter, partial [Pseudomonas asiatica]|nr:MFS transporter [Pseudomonas asiatica]
VCGSSGGLRAGIEPVSVSAGIIFKACTGLVGAALCCEEAITAEENLLALPASSQRKAAPTGTA